MQKNMVAVAQLDQLPEGTLMQVTFLGEEVCLAHVNGQVRAFANACTHEEGPLNEGFLEEERIVCPWHYAEFDVCTGKVLDGPATQDLKVYTVEIHAGDIYLGLESPGQAPSSGLST